MLRFLKWPRSRLQRLGPYQSLIVLAIPVATVEPLKLVAVAFVGTGHWLTGTAVIVAAYVASLLVVERLFQIVKPKLLKLRWFAAGWGWFTKLRARMLSHLG